MPTKPEKRIIHTPQGSMEAELREPKENANYPKGPCPLIHGPCPKNQDVCGFWTDIIELEIGLLQTVKPLIVGSCVFYATMNASMTPKTTVVQGKPGQEPGGKMHAS